MFFRNRMITVINPWLPIHNIIFIFHFHFLFFIFQFNFLFSGVTTRDSAAASKFTALTYISDCKQEADWSTF